MKTPVNKETLRQHLNYGWWKYAIIVLAAIFGWSLVYTMTAYRAPADKKVDFYVASGYGDQEALIAYMENVRQTEMSDMEEMGAVVLINDDTYFIMQLSTYIAAGEGDVYLLAAENFQSYASAGSLLPLENVPEVMDYVNAAGIDPGKGWRTESETRERHLYGIPARMLTGLDEYSVPIEDAYLCVTVNNGNDENSLKFLGILVRDMFRAPETATPTDLAP